MSTQEDSLVKVSFTLCFISLLYLDKHCPVRIFTIDIYIAISESLLSLKYVVPFFFVSCFSNILYIVNYIDYN